MLAPIDKVERGGNPYIQVEITTSCNLNCSNCTRLLPYRKDFRHMTVECFREAVRSLREWPGVVAIFGGNPPAHPRFPELMAILEEEIPEQRRRGLWASNLLKHGELCRRVFYPHGHFNLNAHADEKAAAEIDRWLPGKIIRTSRHRPSLHGAILVDRRDYDVTGETWTALREACDINRHWSGAIVERGGEPYAYFCEIASSLDGVRGENHGLRVYPGWWRERMPRFEEQVRECCDRGCGVPLRLRGHLDSEETYDFSPSWKGQITDRNERRPTDTAVHVDMPAERAELLTDYQRLRSRA